MKVYGFWLLALAWRSLAAHGIPLRSDTWRRPSHRELGQRAGAGGFQNLDVQDMQSKLAPLLPRYLFLVHIGADNVFSQNQTPEGETSGPRLAFLILVLLLAHQLPPLALVKQRQRRQLQRRPLPLFPLPLFPRQKPLLRRVHPVPPV